jgi:hypothetical protein
MNQKALLPHHVKTSSILILLALATSIWPAKADDKWDISKFDVGRLPPAAATKGVTYEKDIRLMLEDACFRCHGDERQKGGLRLDRLDATLKGGKAGKMVVSGDSQKSLLVAAAAQIDDKIAMPPKHGPGGPGENRPPAGPGGGPPPDGQDGPGGHGGPGGFGPPSKPLTAAQVGMLRAWIDQGAK